MLVFFALALQGVSMATGNEGSVVQLAVQIVILAGIVFQGVMQILNRRWAQRDRDEKQAESLAAQESALQEIKRAQQDALTEIKHEVVATTQLQLSQTKHTAEEIKTVISETPPQKGA